MTTKKQIFFHPQRFFLDNVPKQADGTCYVLNSEYGELWAAYGELEQEIERLRETNRTMSSYIGAASEAGKQTETLATPGVNLR